MKVYTKPEIEVEEMVLNISILAGSTWGTENEDPDGPGEGGDDGPAPTNTISIWEE